MKRIEPIALFYLIASIIMLMIFIITNYQPSNRTIFGSVVVFGILIYIKLHNRD